MKIAAIDIGSNSIHMIIAEAKGERSFEVIDREKEMVFLGQSVFEHGRLTAEAMGKGLAALGTFAKLAERHGVDEIRAVATAATREADNGGEFLYAVAERTGIAPQVISGAEEARYIYLSVRHAIDLTERSALIFDIGGGSVEAIVGDARGMRFGRSLRLGVQRLRAEFGRGAPLGKRERQKLEASVTQAASAALADARHEKPDFVVGTSGTILALGQAAHRLRGGEPWASVTGREIRLEALSALTERLVAADPAERAGIGGIDAARASTIHVGGVLLCRLLELAKADRLTLCDAALREGLVLDTLARCADDRSLDVVGDIRRRSVLDLVARCGQSGPHPERVAGLALSLFDQLRPLHGLDDEDRVLLEYGALLHDIGQHIGYERHEHHAAYIIRNADLRGFSDLEREQLALIARYHRKARPKRRDPEIAALPVKRRKPLSVLAGIVRLADGFDRSHHQLVSRLECRVTDAEVVIGVSASGDSELEVWGARRKARVLERAIGRKIAVQVADDTALAGAWAGSP